jgi:hypothetical protein
MTPLAGERVDDAIGMDSCQSVKDTNNYTNSAPPKKGIMTNLKGTLHH